MTELLDDCTGVILAGGENRRMPVLKPFIVVDGRRIIERNLELMRQLFRNNVIVTNQPGHYSYLKTPLLGDVYDTRGPMTGIFTAMLNSSTEWLFVSACDMPFISEAVIRFMALQRGNCDAVVPLYRRKPEPLFAFYSKRLMRLIEKSILSGQKSMRDFLLNYKKRVKYVTQKDLKRIVNGDSYLINLNTPADVDAFLRPEDVTRLKKDLR